MNPIWRPTPQAHFSFRPDWRKFCWKKAHAQAWKTPPREIALARLARAQTLGMSYREYTAVLLDRGVHL